MKKIGLIDCCIDNWHAANFPKQVHESEFGKGFEVTLVWQETAWENSRPIEQYCAESGIAQASGLEQVVDECDCICVLSPRNPERHEDLSAYALASGKPVYIDKPFAPSLEVARRIVERAKSHGSPLMSCSSLRFDAAIVDAAEKIGADAGVSDVSGTEFPKHRVNFMSVRGGGKFKEYAIHQVEMLAALMHTGARRVMQCGTKDCPLVVIDYSDGRRAVINLIPKHAFQFSARYGKDGLVVSGDMTSYWPAFMDAVLQFLDTGVSPIPIEQTLEIAAILEAGVSALDRPDEWVDVPV